MRKNLLKEKRLFFYIFASYEFHTEYFTLPGLKSLFAKALRLESPWEITKIEFHEVVGDIKVFVDFPRGSVFSCPACGKEVKAYDTTEKEWRYLNFFQYACYLVVRVPTTDCPDDGILQIDVPWAREGTDFTFLFEFFAMILVREMPVNKVSRSAWTITSFGE